VSVRRRAEGTCAVIDVDVAACPRCAAGKGCGAGLPAAAAASRRLEVPVAAGDGLAAGDVVELHLDPAHVLRASIIAYGLPMAGAIVGAAAAWTLSLGDAAAAAAALAGLALGLVAGRRRLRREACLRHFLPTVERAR